MTIPSAATVVSLCRRAAALALLTLVSPVLFLAGLWISRVSRGGVFYRQWRLGQFGQPFRIWKLRTMVAEHNGPDWTQWNDPRIIPGGRFLRFTHIDELPQLWNIARGEMAFFGPRPEQPHVHDRLRLSLPQLDDRLQVLPGLTGLAQVTLPPDGSVDSVRRKLQVDLDWCRRRSFRLNFWILRQTAGLVCGLWRPWQYGAPAPQQLAHPVASAKRTDSANRLPLSVILPVRNEARYLPALFHALAGQSLPRHLWEWILVDGESTDSSRAIAQSWLTELPNGQVLRNPKRWSSVARNLAAQVSRGEYLLIIDGHVQIPDADYLQRTITAFHQTTADALGRPQPLLSMGDSGADAKSVAIARHHWLGHNPHSDMFGGKAGPCPARNVAVAYRRDLWQMLGGFDEHFDACEDVEFNVRWDKAGYSCFFAPELELPYYARENSQGLYQQMVRYGLGRARLTLRHPTTCTLATLIPPGLVFYLLTLPAWLTLSLFALVPVGLYAGLLFTLGIIVGSRHKLPHYKLIRNWLGIHVGFGVGYWQGIWESARHWFKGWLTHTGSLRSRFHKPESWARLRHSQQQTRNR